MINFKEFLKEDSVQGHADLLRRLRSHYDFHEDEVPHIKHHTDESFYMNRYLWDKHNNRPNLYKAYGAGIKDLEKDSNKLNNILVQHEAPEEFHVYSGVRDPRQRMVEGILHHPAFLSTSHNPNKAKNFSRQEKYENPKEDDKYVIHTFKIRIPKGSKFGAHISHISEHPNEQEFLMKKGLNLHIHNSTRHEINNPISGHMIHYQHEASVL